MELGWLDFVVIIVLYGVLETGAWFAWEKAAVKRMQDRAKEQHQELEGQLEAFSRDQLTRIAHAVRNHVEGPLHKRK